MKGQFFPLNLLIVNFLNVRIVVHVGKVPDLTPGSICGSMCKRIQELEKRPGSSFIAIFDRALELGIISRRRVYYEAMKYERNRRSSSGSLLGFSKFSNSTAAEDVKSIEVIARDIYL